MIKKLFFAGVSFVTAKRDLAATAKSDKNKLVEFDMDHANDEGYKFHYANKGDDWSNIEGLPVSDNLCIDGI